MFKCNWLGLLVAYGDSSNYDEEVQSFAATGCKSSAPLIALANCQAVRIHEALHLNKVAISCYNEKNGIVEATFKAASL